VGVGNSGASSVPFLIVAFCLLWVDCIGGAGVSMTLGDLYR